MINSIVEDKDIKERIGAGVPPKLLLGGAGLISSMGDYEKFCRMLLNKGKLNGKRVLSERASEIVMTKSKSRGVCREILEWVMVFQEQ